MNGLLETVTSSDYTGSKLDLLLLQGDKHSTFFAPVRGHCECQTKFFHSTGRSVRQECLDQLIIVNERHLNAVLREYVDYYNVRRPHQGIGQRCPVGPFESLETGTINRRIVLGGLINDYYREVA